MGSSRGGTSIGATKTAAANPLTSAMRPKYLEAASLLIVAYLGQRMTKLANRRTNPAKITPYEAIWAGGRYVGAMKNVTYSIPMRRKCIVTPLSVKRAPQIARYVFMSSKARPALVFTFLA